MSRIDHAGRRTAVAALLAVALAGCQWVDTRPGVTILPAGDLSGREYVDVQVDAGGAPQVQMFVDGKKAGDPQPTGQTIHVDLRPFAVGEHELVARVEMGSSPRTSEKRRLVRLDTPITMTFTWTSTREAWNPYVVVFTASTPIGNWTATVTGPDGAPVQFTEELSRDRRQLTVQTVKTLGAIGTVTVAIRATGEFGATGEQVVTSDTLDLIGVSWAFGPGSLELSATPQVPVPGATLWAGDGTGREVNLGEQGASPWHVVLPDGVLGSGDRWFEFRRSDVKLQRGSVNVPLPRPFVLCDVQDGATSPSPYHAAVMAFPFPVGEVSFVPDWLGRLPPAGFSLERDSDSRWLGRVSGPLWKSGPVTLNPSLDVRSTLGFPFSGGNLSCAWYTAWNWRDPGADPITDGSRPIQGDVVAVWAPDPGNVFVAYVGRAGAPDEGLLHVASRGAAPGTFVPGSPVNATAATGFGVSLGNSSGVAWRRSDVAGTVEGMIRQTVGAAWSPWPPDPLSSGSLGGSAPAVAGDASGPTVVAWVEGGDPGGNCIQVRWAGAGWGLLAPICTHAPPGGVYAPSVAAAGPTAAGPVVGYYDLDGTGAGTWNLVAWDGTAWHELVSPERGSFGTTPAPQQFGSDATQVWKWTPVYLFAPPGAIGGLPRDGRPPFLVSTIQGSPNVVLGQHGGAYRLTGAGTPAAAWNYVSPSPNASNIDGSVAASIAHVVLDPDGMSVAWTDADGFIHVRTLTP